MLFEGRATVATPEAVHAKDDARPVFERVPSERSSTVRVGVGVHLIRQ
jgi:hypothetical protein